MHENRKAEFENTYEISSADIQCSIITSKKHSIFEDESTYVVVCGEIFIDEAFCDAAIIGEKFTAYKKSFDELYQHISGQFWLLIFDKTLGQLTVLNDHFGMQSCFYTQQNNTIFISDSLKQLKKVENISLNISEQALFNYMYFHCIPSPNTIFTEVSKLEPGKAIMFNSKGDQQEQLLYKPAFNKQLESHADQHKACLDTIEHAVKKHAEGKVGAFLSGGLDSSSVAGMLARHEEEAKTFSIGFTIKGYDETEYAKITAKHFGTKHEVLYLEADEAAEEFVRVAQYFDEPFGNSSAMATYFCAKFAKSYGIERLLAGDGGDELFAGNDRYAKQKIFEIYQGIPSVLQGAAKGLLCKTPLGKVPLLSKGASYINQAEIPLPDRLETYNFLNRFGVQAMFNKDFLASVDTQVPIQQQRKRFQECSSDHSVDQMLYLDWKFTLADNDLVKVGRMCEMADVEVRYPLLDKSVVDFSCTIPADIKLPGGKLRHFYKESCRGFLADNTLTKSKHGFGLPFGLWMKENQTLKEIALDNLLAFKKRKIVNDSLIDNVLDAHNSVHASYYGELIWIMVVLELWLQQ